MPLKVHFLNVGRGDCTIIEFPSGRIGMVDIDNLTILDPDTRRELLEEYRESLNYHEAVRRGQFPTNIEENYIRSKEAALTDPLAYYDTHIGRDKDIFRLMVTHPDMDHMTGLYRLHVQDSRKSIVNFWHTGKEDFNLANCTDEDWERGPYDKRDWETYKQMRGSKSSPIALHRYQGDTGDFWTEDGIELWAPTKDTEKEAIEKDEPNLISMVLKISYKGRSILLGGDATVDGTWPSIYPDLDMEGINVLKASHHGRKTGYYRPAVKEMSPWLTITSVGEKAYDATERYRYHSEHTVSLRKAGDICITIDDSGVLHYPAEIKAHWKTKKQ